MSEILVDSANMNDKKYIKPATGAVLAGVAGGYATKGLASSVATSVSSSICSKEFNNITKALSEIDKNSLTKASKDVFESSKLADKGVELIKADFFMVTPCTGTNKSLILDILKKEADNGVLKHCPQKLKDGMIKNYMKQIKNGQNAFFMPVTNKIVLPKIGCESAVFHEMGHAMNANLSKFGKYLQKCRPLAIIANVMFIIALLKTKKEKDEKPKGFVDKTTDFIKNNVGKLSFLAFVPTILEEGLASYKGEKLAKNFLSADLMKKVVKTNRIGLFSYTCVALVTALAARLGVQIRDEMAHKQPAETVEPAK